MSIEQSDESENHEEQSHGRGRPRGGPGRDERRAELLDVAIRVIYEKGARATLNEIAGEAGLTKPALYAHFEGKSGLAGVIGEVTRAKLSSAFEDALARHDDPRTAFRSAIRAFMMKFGSELALIKFVIVWLPPDQPDDRLPKFTHDLGLDLAEILARHLQRANADIDQAEAWAFGLMGMCYVASEWWLRKKQPFTFDVLIDHLTESAWDGLVSTGIDNR